MNIINKTPHTIRIRLEKSGEALPLDSDLVIAPTLPAVRLTHRSTYMGEVNGIPVEKQQLVEVANFPDPLPGTVYVVSTLVAQYAALIGRNDMVAPNTAPKQDIRYPEGHKFAGLTFAVRKFQQF